MSDIRPTFQGEVQFRRYSDTSTQGVQVVLALADRESLQSFIGKEGKRFMAVLVEIGDDEAPVQPPVKVGPLCREACDYCVNADFLQWRGGIDTTAAKAWILDLCDVKSRKELDTDRQAGADFVNLVRAPFLRWQREQRK